MSKPQKNRFTTTVERKFRRVRNCLDGAKISVKATINFPTVVYQGPNYSYFPKLPHELERDYIKKGSLLPIIFILFIKVSNLGTSILLSN